MSVDNIMNTGNALHQRRTFSSIKVGDELSSETLTVTRADLIRFAGASCDFNPIHWDDDAAQALGLESVIMHGLFEMAFVAAYVNRWSGDATQLCEFDVRFISPVFVNKKKGGELTVSGKVKKVSVEDKTVTVALVGTSRGVKVFGRAMAVIKIA